jgi:carbonic anhydrase/acetyltransferase-like protein (isoleucine patch superfamily)/dTDP-4-dehydrorhamnose 3,5-epimerase-like enzyme
VPGQREPPEFERGSASIHPTAVVTGAVLDPGCEVLEYASVAPGARLAAGVTVGPGARVLSDSRIERGARVGANATICESTVVARGAVVEPGSVVASNVPPYAVVRGNPARIEGYVDSMPGAELAELDVASVSEVTPTSVPGVTLHPFRRARDLRGSLAALELSELPFVPRRLFAVYDVPSESVRGAHAHRSCAQLLVCVSGALSCVADDGTNRQGFRLASPDVGVLIPPLVWGMQYRYTHDAVLIVLAELPYDPDDYIRDYEEFLALVAGR